MNLFNKFKSKFSLLKNTSKFSNNLAKRLYERYIGNSKIIAWHNGCLMYTTVSPTLLSTQFAKLRNQ